MTTAIEAPSSTTSLPTPARSSTGIFGVANTVDLPSEHWVYGGIDYDQICSGAHTTTAFCLAEGQSPEEKTPFASEWGFLQPVAVYALHECSSIGVPVADRAAKAEAAHEVGLSTALEEFLTGAVAADEDTTTATATGDVEALATAAGMPGFATGRALHINPAMAVRLTEYLTREGGQVTLIDGTPVAVGDGYPDGQVLVTGRVILVEGSRFTTETVLNQKTNVVSVLAEQPWALGWECGAAVITVGV